MIVQRQHRAPATAIALALLAISGCRGQASRKAPIHIIQNMTQQERFDTQEPNPFFADGRAMRPEVPGTIPVGGLKEDDLLFRGRLSGEPADVLPMKLDPKLLARGQQRFGIYCTPCHDAAGTGDGIIIHKGMTPPPSFHEPRIKAKPLGAIFETISRGERNMPSYAAQIPVEDRWAIAAYVRALQLSRDATIDQVPHDVAAAKGWTR
jgi:mono/diheme cytochrome c family protein